QCVQGLAERRSCPAVVVALERGDGLSTQSLQSFLAFRKTLTVKVQCGHRLNLVDGGICISDLLQSPSDGSARENKAEGRWRVEFDKELVEGRPGDYLMRPGALEIKRLGESTGWREGAHLGHEQDRQRSSNKDQRTDDGDEAAHAARQAGESHGDLLVSLSRQSE